MCDFETLASSSETMTSCSKAGASWPALSSFGSSKRMLSVIATSSLSTITSEISNMVDRYFCR